MSSQRRRSVDRVVRFRKDQLFGGPVTWDWSSQVLEVAADRSFESVLHLLDEEEADWLVVVRTMAGVEDVHRYVFRRSEVQRLASSFPERLKLSIEFAAELHEWSSSRASRGQRPIGPEYGHSGAAAGRIVDYDAFGRIVGIGEREDMIPRPAAEERSDTGKGSAYDDAMSDRREVPIPENIEFTFPDLDLGPMRGGTGAASPGPPPASRSAPPSPQSPPPSPPPSGAPPSPPFTAESPPPPGADVEVVLSAETRSEINVGTNTRVSFSIELATEAVPLSESLAAHVKDDQLIAISLSTENDAIEISGKHEMSVKPPLSGEPRNGSFAVRGVREGVCRLAVAFRQGGTDLGVIGLAVEVVQQSATTAKAKGEAVAAPRDVVDDDKLLVTVRQTSEGTQVFYDYFLHSESLGLIHRLRSKPLLDRGGGPAATALAFVERIYERVTQELKSVSDLKEVQREARALGASLCQELLDPDVAKVLWPLRDRIKLVQVVSWEPYIPWELVRLRDPDTGDIDERFLCEYGLVRTLSDTMPPRTIPMRNWAYLGATFPFGSFPPVGAELDYFTTSSPGGLHDQGITPKPIAATRDAFYDAIGTADFDVLHISCHAESQHQSIERASLIIGDETVPGSDKPRLIEVDTIKVGAEARFKKRQPLVFLNACETGRVGAVLTAWGGWPNVFLRQGAGAFVGAAWAVRDKPAAVFSTAFYNALLAGNTLAEAATAARAAAKKLGDASWLAFKVYGHPRARCGRT